MRRWGKIAVACLLAVLLAAFGISQIGGETWITASAPLADGFMRDVHGGMTRHRETARLVPVILVLALAAGSVAHAYLTRPKEEKPVEPERES